MALPTRIGMRSRPAPVQLAAPPIPEIVDVTEFSRGLGRRIFYASDDTFAGIVNIQNVHLYDSSTILVLWGCKETKRSPIK